MTRRKKQDLEEELLGSRKKSAVHGDAKRSIVAVFLFALAVVFLLGFLDMAGKLGQYLDKFVGFLFGWGKWISSAMLITGGIVLLYRKETIFYVTKILGLIVTFFSFLGFLHFYLEPEKFWELARNGEGGGVGGFAIAYVLVKTAGIYAGTVILGALLIIGLILTFNLSIASFLQRLISIWFRRKEEKGFEAETQEPSVETETTSEQKETEHAELSEERVWIEENRKIMPQFSVKPVSEKPREKREKLFQKPKRWESPPLELLEMAIDKAHGGDVNRNAKIIQDTLKHFGIEVELGGIEVGPTVTQYSFRPAEGVKLSKITTLHNDLALALAEHPIRIEAPIPGKSLIGIEVPNKSRAQVKLRNLLQSEKFKKKESKLTLALGEDVSGNYFFADLQKMPHLLIAGSTGTGKSVCINSILLTLLYQNSPEDMRLILIDPKRVELSPYNGIPHLLSDAIVENGKALSAFKWAISEMERRYRIFQDTSSRDLESYNQKVISGVKRKHIDQETGEAIEEEISKLPYIIIVIDELADLMASHGKEVEGAIIRLAQMARAVGIHLIVSTQRPSVEVLTGLIKANIGTRIAFKVATQIDSRTILDASGAEKLLGNGDMLLLSAQSAKLKRIQGVMVSESEVKKVVRFIEKQKYVTGKKELNPSVGIFDSQTEKVDFSAMAISHPQLEDDLYEEAKRIVIESGKASSSLLQRRLRVGYARAARLIDMLEEQGVIGPGEGAKPRVVLLSKNSAEPIGIFASQQKVKGDESQDEKIDVDDYNDIENETEIKDNKEHNEQESKIDQENRDKWQI